MSATNPLQVDTSQSAAAATPTVANLDEKLMLEKATEYLSNQKEAVLGIYPKNHHISPIIALGDGKYQVTATATHQRYRTVQQEISADQLKDFATKQIQMDQQREQERLQFTQERMKVLPGAIKRAEADLVSLKQQLAELEKKNINNLSEKDRIAHAKKYIDGSNGLALPGIITYDHSAVSIVKSPNKKNYEVSASDVYTTEPVKVEITPTKLDEFAAEQLAYDIKLKRQDVESKALHLAELNTELVNTKQKLEPAAPIVSPDTSVTPSALLQKMQATGKEIDNAITQAKQLRQQEIDTAKLLKPEHNDQDKLDNEKIRTQARDLNTKVKDKLKEMQSLINNLRNDNPNPGSKSPEDELVKSYNTKLQNLMGYELPDAPNISGRKKESLETGRYKQAAEETHVATISNFERDMQAVKGAAQIQNVEDITNAKKHEGIVAQEAAVANQEAIARAAVNQDSRVDNKHARPWKDAAADKQVLDRIKSTFSSNQYKDILQVKDVTIVEGGKNISGLHIKSTANQKIDFTATADNITGEGNEDNLKAMSTALVDNLKARMDARPPQTGLSIDLSGCKPPAIAKEFEKHIKEAMTKYPDMTQKVEIKKPEEPRVSASIVTAPAPPPLHQADTTQLR